MFVIGTILQPEILDAQLLHSTRQFIAGAGVLGFRLWSFDRREQSRWGPPGGMLYQEEVVLDLSCINFRSTHYTAPLGLYDFYERILTSKFACSGGLKQSRYNLRKVV
jgi:hypothetical protein